LLRASYDIFGTKVVLPLLNMFIAAAAGVIFLWRAPFLLWLDGLFVLSAIFVYGYSVMACSYGIVMLLRFGYASIYTAARLSSAWLVLILLLLTQPHIIAMLLVPFYLLIWFGDGWRARRSGSVPHDPLAWVIVAAVVSSAGIMAAMATVYPTNNDLMVQDFPDATRVLHAIGSAILQPGHFYCGPDDP